VTERPSVRAHARPLTARECRILDRIGRDRTHKDIAAELGISINTVANLAAKAYRKLGAQRRSRRARPP
jgi:DNA-binding CsgD family transcriptional regulator